MKNKNIQLNLRFEFAIEVIIYSVIIILFGLAFLFTSNLLSFNWVSALCILSGLGVIYLKASSFIKLIDEVVILQYFKFFTKKTVAIENIDQFIFYEDSHLVEIKTKKQETIPFYLKDKNRKKLLGFIVQSCPETPCLFYDRTDETAR